MASAPVRPPQDAAIQIIDANLNRVAEGLRVVEDYLRFGRRDQLLAGRCKAIRHELASAANALDRADLIAARASHIDVGRETKTNSEFIRNDMAAIATAAIKRVEQGLRSLEEFAKLGQVATEIPADVHPARRFESLRYACYELERAMELADTVRRLGSDRTLCVLVDARRDQADFDRLVDELVEAETPLIQIRIKQLDDKTLLSRCRRAREATAGSKTLLVINDRADLAAMVDADGLHIGQDDIPLLPARRIVGDRLLVGVSTHNLSQATAAAVAGADYLGIGPTFSSHTKSFDAFAGLETLRQVASVELPTFAIGGIDLDNLESVLETGIRRVAVQHAIVSAENVRATVAAFLDRLAQCARHDETAIPSHRSTTNVVAEGMPRK